MRQAKSYSIVDHQLLHGGFLARLTHTALALYLFSCVVGDKEGKSYYGDASVMRILRFPQRELDLARSELVTSRLIEYSRPYTQVLCLTKPSRMALHAEPPRLRKMPAFQSADDALDDGLRPVREIIPEGLKALLKSLEDR